MKEPKHKLLRVHETGLLLRLHNGLAAYEEAARQAAPTARDPEKEESVLDESYFFQKNMVQQGGPFQSALFGLQERAADILTHFNKLRRVPAPHHKPNRKLTAIFNNLSKYYTAAELRAHAYSDSHAVYNSIRQHLGGTGQARL